MKSFFSVLPLVGLALAQESCPETVTETYTPTVTVMAPPYTPSSSSIDYVTMTTVITQWYTVTATPLPSFVPWYPNGTFNYTARLPTTLSTVSYLPASSSVVEGESTTDAPVYSSPPAEASKSAAIPTSETAAAPAPSSEAVVDTPAAAISAANKGEATFYGGNVGGGMCSFTGYTIPSGLYGTALSDSNWAGAGNCGACVAVTGPDGNKVTAMVVDQCPGCGSNHLDLFPDAFAKLAAPSKGVIPVSWSIVPCGITSPIILKNKEGTSPYWFSMQVMNSNVPVSKLEVSTDGGKSWKATARQPYNYFENASGFGTQTVDVKITSTSGQSIIVNGVSITANSKKTAGSNFS